MCWRDAPFTPETACQTLTEQKGTNNRSVKGGDNRGDNHSRAGRDGFNPNITSCSELHFGLDNSCSLSNQHFFHMIYVEKFKKSNNNYKKM